MTEQTARKLNQIREPNSNQPITLLPSLLLKEGIRKVLENELPSSKDGITPEGKTLH